MKIRLFFNIKFNKNISFTKYLPNFLTSRAPKIINHKIQEISEIKQGSFWKTTKYNRNYKLINWLNKYIKSNKDKTTILEIGASSGISIFPGLREKKKIRKYILTDLNVRYYYKNFYNWKMLFQNKEDIIPFMAFDKLIIIYSDYKSLNVILTLFSFIIRILLSIVTFNKKKIAIHLLDKKIFHYQKKYSLIIEEYNILLAWQSSKVNLILAVNVLNASYFSKDQMNSILINIFNTLQTNGLVIVAGNRKSESISVFKKSKKRFILIHNKGGLQDSHYQFINFKK